MLTGPKLTRAERARLSWQGPLVFRHLPGVNLVNRLLLSTEWYEAMADALNYQATFRGYEWDREPGLRLLLDTQLEPLSNLEKQIIFCHATHRNEA